VNHFGSVNAKTVEIDCWLVVDPDLERAWNQRPKVRVTAGPPSLGRAERAINLKLSLPRALFEAPALTASIKVAEPDRAISIDTTAVAEAVRQVIGMDVSIAVAPPEERQG
jgi:hypothetical protein